MYNIYTGDESWIYTHEPKINSNRLYGSSKMSQIQQLFALETNGHLFFFWINGYVATVLEDRRTVNSE